MSARTRLASSACSRKRTNSRSSAADSRKDHGQERIRVLPRLLVAIARLGVELPDVGQFDVQDARRQAHADPRLELLRRVDRLRRIGGNAAARDERAQLLTPRK